MIRIPLRHSVVHVPAARPVDPPEWDPFGRPILAPPDERVVRVYGWAPAGFAEGLERNAAAVSWDLDLLAPPDVIGATSERDQFRVLGHLFDVDGRPADYSHGPHGQQPGGVIRLVRHTG